MPKQVILKFCIRCGYKYRKKQKNHKCRGKKIGPYQYVVSYVSVEDQTVMVAYYV